MHYLIIGITLSSLVLMGCANVEDKQNHRDAQIEMVERQMIARQRIELDRAQAQAQWAAAMAAVAAASPENADAIAVGLAVAAVRNSDGGSRDMPVVTLQRDVNEALEWAKQVVDRGAGEIVLTSMDADGTQDGYDLEITAAVADAVDVPVVASGGCGSPEHIYEVLTKTGADAALAASIFHYGQYSIQQTKALLAERGVPVRQAAAVC